MPNNDIQSASPVELVLLTNQISSGLGTGATNPYGVPAEQKTALTTTTLALNAMNAVVENAKAAYHSAVRNREASRAACASAAATVARTVYANPAVTPGMVAALGLSPRSRSRARILPFPPVEVTVTPVAAGDLLVKWNRGANARGVNFVVEAQTGTGEWAFVGDTTATRLTLSGYAPGSTLSLRVSASKNGTVSTPSAAVAPYPVPAAAPLRLAA